MKKLFSNWMKGAMLVSVALTFPFVMDAQTGTVQNPANPPRTFVWYFGDHAGLDFSSGTATPILNGAMETFECAASMADNSGNLLFYSNGGDFPYTGGVWNRNHQLMPNGTMAGRGGCNSSEQGALIVPLPRSHSVYYLFTTDCMEHNGIAGLRYNIIDMNADGGLGDVVSASGAHANHLIAPADESLTAIQHANGLDWWIVSHKLQTDSFYVYHLNYHGIVGVVKTKIGNVTPMWAGSLKASTDGQKLVYAGLNWTSLFDFDTRTGIISNHIDLGLAGYTASFSPNCRFLYVATGSGQTIYQFDVASPNIPASKVQVGTTVSTGFGGLALGPDGRIYCSRFVTSDYLGVIKYPNRPGTQSSYIDDGQYLGGKSGQGGLPNFANNLLGGCVEMPEENTSHYGSQNYQLMAENTGSHSIHVSWTDAEGMPSYRLMYREAGTQGWNHITVNENNATIEDLKANTNYEMQVMAVQSGPGYEPLNDHLTDDDIAAAKTGTTASTSDITVAKTNGEFEFDMYPNPSHGATSVALNIGDVNSDMTIKVTDIQGKVVSEEKKNNVSGYNRFELATNNLPDGIYNIQIESATSATVKKLVIVR